MKQDGMKLLEQDWKQRSLRLASGVELLQGPNGLPLLHVSSHRRYVRLSFLGAEVIGLLTTGRDITQADISQTLSTRYPGSPGEIRHHVDQFLRQLDDAGVLESDKQEPETGFRKLMHKVVEKPRLQIALWRPDRPLASGLISAVRAKASGLIGVFVGLLVLFATVAAGFAINRLGMSIDYSSISWPLILALLIVHTSSHEMSHALVSSYYNVRVREFGIGLLYYFLPTAYTDRTDAYRLRRFAERAWIALAGPIFDLSAAGLSAVLAYSTGGRTRATFHLLMLIQLWICFSNLNPLLPTDGYHVLEAKFGGLNFRRRAFTLLFRMITGKDVPPQLRTLTAHKKLFHLSYAVVASLYIGLLAMMFIMVAGNAMIAQVKQ